MTSIYDRLSEERKKLQDQDLAPAFWSTGGYQLFKEKYLYQAANPREQYERIARTLAVHTPDPQKWYGKFFDIMWKGWLSPSTPILANTGTTRGLPVSCAGSYFPDSIDGIYKAKHETAMLTKYGFGTAGYLGDVRPRGSKISVGGKSLGILPIIQGVQHDMEYVAQGTARRGSWAGYVPVDHGDFDEVCSYLEQHPDGNNIGWVWKDSDTEKMNAGDPEAIRRFQKMLKTKMVTGKGYLSFIDKQNRARPQWYKDHGLDIKAPQLCVVPETLILTKQGYKEIADFEDKAVEIWNGKEWSNVLVRKTGEDQKVIKVTTKDGYELECTPEHKFYKVVRKPTSGVTKTYEIAAKDLKRGDKLIKFDLPVIEGEETLENAYLNGFFTGDGCHYEGKQLIYFYGDKRKLIEEIDMSCCTYHIVQEKQDREVFHTNSLKDKFFVPRSNYTVESRIQWLAGLLDSDGTVHRNGKTQGLAISSVNHDFLKNVQFMLQELGVISKVTKMCEAGVRQLPLNNGSGKNGDFMCQDAYRLLLGNTEINKLQALGLNPKRLKLTDHKPNRECSHFIKVSSVIDEGRISDTYCFTEHKRHMGMFNGLLTGQCNEIILHSSEDYTYTCVLASMNLLFWDDWKDTDAVFTATVFLDAVAQEFIEKAKNISGLEKAVAFTKKSRALGLGAMGLHSLYQSKMLPFGSLEAYFLNTEIFSHIREEAEKATKWIAEHYGEPEWCKGYGRANSHLLAIAPTKSTSLIMSGVSEGINPDTAMVFTQRSAGGEIDRVNPFLLKLMKERGVYNKATVERIRLAMGSVQNENWLTPEEKLVFLTAFEMNQMDILNQAVDRGVYLDQWQSLNTFFAAEEDEEVIARIHQHAIEEEGILGLYYVYSRAGVQASNGECLACQ